MRKGTREMLNKFEMLCAGIVLEGVDPVPYPLEVSEKGKLAVDSLNKGIEDKMILNPVFQDAKSRLNNNIELITWHNGNVLGPEGMYNVAYRVDAIPHGLRDVPKAIKGLKTIVDSPELPAKFTNFNANFSEEWARTNWIALRDGMRKYLKILESWLPVIKMLDELKPLIVKGRQPNPNAVPSFQPQKADPATEKIVVDVLNQLAAPLKPKVVETLVAQDEKYVKRFQESGLPVSYNDIRKFFKNDIEAMKVVDSCLNPAATAIIPNYRDKLTQSATRSVNDMVTRFISKNVEKIAPLLARKQGSEARVLHGNLDGIGFSGEISFKFNDGTSFVVRNKVVMKYTAMQQQFLQFPTTFHNVVFPDGSKKAMQSEEQMHKDWLK